jgi:hypothetical protein
VDDSGGDSGLSDWGGGSTTSDEEHRYGGLVLGFRKGGVIDKFVNKLRTAGDVVRAQTGKWIGRRHGKLPGYGGGDRVRVLAEPGEYFVRKEAVSKYGKSFMDSVNNMRFPSRGVDSTAVARSVGGIIGDFREELRMARGGPIARQTANVIAKPYTIIKPMISISPMFMTGDRGSMRVAAKEIRKQLYEIDRALGGSNG